MDATVKQSHFGLTPYCMFDAILRLTMRRYFIVLFALGLLLPIARPVRAADAYANSIFGSSTTNLSNTEVALGAPDGLSVGFEQSGIYVVLDMGEGEEGTGDLIVTQLLRDVGAIISFTFYNGSWETLATGGDYAPNGSTWTIVYNGSTPYRYIRIESYSSHPWSLDAVTASSYVGETVVVDDEPVDEEPVEEEAVDSVPDFGDLIKSDEFSAAYLLGSDGRRHAFPNETVFLSWGYSFDDVVTLSVEDLASYTLGRNVTIKPATYLVKLQTNPKVYAVAPDATLRWVTGESVAASLYGTDWANDVLDVADVFWGNYSVGEDIDETSDAEGWEVPEHAF